MVVWGVTDINNRGCKIDKERLEPLGLICWGGSSKNNDISYHVYNQDKSFDVNVSYNDFKKIDKTYIKFLRKRKLNYLNEKGR